MQSAVQRQAMHARLLQLQAAWAPGEEWSAALEARALLHIAGNTFQLCQLVCNLAAALLVACFVTLCAWNAPRSARHVKAVTGSHAHMPLQVVNAGSVAQHAPLVVEAVEAEVVGAEAGDRAWLAPAYLHPPPPPLATTPRVRPYLYTEAQCMCSAAGL